MYKGAQCVNLCQCVCVPYREVHHTAQMPCTSSQLVQNSEQKI